MCDWFARLGVKHILLILLLIFYSLLGALIFIKLELDEDLAKKNETYQDQLRRFEGKKIIRNQATRDIAVDWDRLATIDQKANRIKELLDYYEKDVLNCELEEPEMPESVWNIWGGLFYSGTIYTTIGYGNIYCSTRNGKIATMIYALIGIPITISILNDWGSLLFSGCIHLWNWIIYVSYRMCTCCPTCIKRLFFGKMLKQVDQGENDEDAHANVPLLVAIVILVSWTCICAAIFLISEDWDYFTSFYFFFISLTTIGFGDVTPKNYKFTCLAFILVLFGLAVVSMTINVIQTKVDQAFDDLLSVIEADFKDRLLADEQLEEVNGKGGRKFGPGMLGMMNIAKKQPLAQRLLFQLMGEHKKKQLAQKVDKLGRLRCKQTQTEVQTKESTVQVHHYGSTHIEIDDDMEQKPWHEKSFGEKKMYIYKQDEPMLLEPALANEDGKKRPTDTAV